MTRMVTVRGRHGSHGSACKLTSATGRTSGVRSGGHALLWCVIAGVAGTWVSPLQAQAVNTDVVISQVYGGGGNSGATLTHDFIELFNRGTSPVSVNGWSVQYASSTGSSWNKTNLPNVTLSPGQYLLVQEAAGTGGTQPLPVPDATGTIAMSASAGKVVLRSTNVAFTSGTVCPSGADVIDIVGYGPATTCSETAPTAPNLSNTTAALRASAGCADTNSNLADFSNGSPNPRNSVSPFNVCGAPANQPIVATCPATLGVTVGVGGSANISANDADGFVSTTNISGAPGFALANIVAGSTLTAQLDVASTVLAGNYGVTITFGNNDATPQTANCIVLVTVAPPVVATLIHDIQGATHISPLNGQSVTTVPGIVTAKTTNGFWLQDPSPDSNPATSEGIFVFTSSAPTVTVGDSIQVSGTVQEFRPGGVSADNLTTTEIVSPNIVTLSTGNALPSPTLLGIGGRAIPTTVIDDDAIGNVETSGIFDAANDGIDFYESLEGMRVQINNPVAVGPGGSFGEIPVLADNGVNASVRSGRGGIVIASNDFNPERMVLDDTLQATPIGVDVGDNLTTITAIVDYSFGNFKFNLTAPVSVIDNGPAPEVSSLVGTGSQLTVGSFNVENLAPTDPASKFDALAIQIVDHLNAPDIVALMEVQDNNGATNDGVVDATTTFSTLIAAIQAAGGPTYQFRSINPVDDQDGGQPGGNIRVGYLFNPARVTFVDHPGAGPTTTNSVVNNGGAAQLQFSPGRIDPTNSAFSSSRKPLASEFVFNGHRVFVIANHFSSKGGDDPLFGRVQPPLRSSEVQRHQQAVVVRDFVQSILAVDANANVIVLGDLNDFEFSETLSILKTGTDLVDLVDALPAAERYTYVYEGNSQVLDHILVSGNLATNAAPEYDIVHVNAEYELQTSDHEPEVVRLALPMPATFVDVTAQVATYSSGLTFKRKTKTYEGTITITNTSATAIAGPLQLELGSLSAGVTLVNASGNHGGNPYITTAVAGLAPGGSVVVSVTFSNPARVGISYSARVYSGTF